jgi:hypothetical protein
MSKLVDNFQFHNFMVHISLVESLHVGISYILFGIKLRKLLKIYSLYFFAKKN